MADSETGLGFPPPHPGEYLKEDIMPELGMTVGELATRLGVKRATLSELINQRRSVSMVMAIRLGKAFQNGARFWLALQMQYDLWNEERRKTIKVDPIKWNDGAAA
jgi:addiction module HigA family antidote